LKQSGCALYLNSYLAALANPKDSKQTALSSAVTLVVGTTTTSTANDPQGIPFSGYAGGVSLAGLLFCLAFRRYNRKAFSMLASAFLVFAVPGLSACDNGNGVTPVSKGMQHPAARLERPKRQPYPLPCNEVFL